MRNRYKIFTILMLLASIVLMNLRMYIPVIAFISSTYPLAYIGITKSLIRIFRFLEEERSQFVT